MLDQIIIDELGKILGINNVYVDEPMDRHTTFKIGGPADCLVTPETVEQIREVIHLLKEKNVSYYVIGNGSNLLVSDDGYRGVIIQLFDKFNKYEFVHEGTASAVDKNNKVLVKAQSGVMLGRLGNAVADYSLSGFEFATGIPGTIGGAVMMNAGAYGGEMKDIIVKATVMTEDGKVLELSNEELELGYRTSIVAEKSYIVLDATISLTAGSKSEIMSRIKELAGLRREKQPLEYPSAGSTFKRPEGYFAGKLISDAGLKGFTVGGAQVSEKHAGFVINRGNATAKDVIELTDKVRDKILELNGVTLELEVRKLGF